MAAGGAHDLANKEFEDALVAGFVFGDIVGVFDDDFARGGFDGGVADLRAEAFGGDDVYGSAAGFKKVFTTMFESGRRADDIVAAEGLGAQVSDSAIEAAARDVVAKNPDNVAKFKSGNEGVFKFFVGQVMRATRGQADPQAVNDILRRLLS